MGRPVGRPTRRPRRSAGKREKRRDATRRAYQALELQKRGISPAAISKATQLPEDLVEDLLERMHKARKAHEGEEGRSM